MIINPMKSFSKNDLTTQGYKLVFLDTCVLKRLTETVIEKFNTQKLKIITNYLVLVEFIIGLNINHPKFQEHLKNKEKVMELLDLNNAFCMLNHQYILENELKYVHKNLVHLPNGLNDVQKNLAHNAHKNFIMCPVDKHQGLFSPYEPTCTYKGLLKDMLPDLKNIKKSFEEGKSNNAKSDTITQLEIAKMGKTAEKIFLEKLDEKQISNYLQCSIEESAPVLKKIKEGGYNLAPYYTVENYIYLQRMKKENESEKSTNTKSGNNFIDSQYAISALSYCDSFCTQDRTLQTDCKKIIEDMQLEVKIINEHFEEI